jgi:transposase
MDQLPDLDQLSERQKDALIQVLWAETQALKAQIAQLESQLAGPKKGSHNSSVPPSKTPKASKPDVNSRRGRRKASMGRAGGGRPLHPDPDQTVIAQVKVCPHCGQEVASEAQKLHALYDKIELPPVRPRVTRVCQYGGQCAHCGEVYVAPVPLGLEPGSPYGASVESLVTYLRYTHAISYERLSGLLGQVFGLAISEGALANLLQRVKQRLDERVVEILERLRRSRLICSDETGARVRGQNQWEWVFQNDQVCLHVIRPSRGHGVIEEVLGKHRPQVWVSDLYSAQRHHPAAQWQVCLAHQLRDCQFAIEAGDRVFAPVMKRVLLRAFVIHRRRGRLAKSTLYQYRCNLERRLEYCLALTPTQRDGVRLKKRYLRIRDNLFLFLEDAAVPPTNNSSEQAIRLSAIFRKVTNGFRSDWGRDLFGEVRSVVNTGHRQGLSPFQAIQRALSLSSSLFKPS